MIVVGVDPGARRTGIVAVSFEGPDRRLLADASVTGPRDTPLDQPAPEYLAEIGAQLTELARLQRVDYLAIEGLVKPNPHLGITGVDALIAAAAALGAALSWAGGGRSPAVLVVRPGRNGSRPLGSYPAALVSAAERRDRGWQLRTAGKGKLKDARSAWDVAVEAHRLAQAREWGRAGGLPTQSGPYTY